MLPVLPPTGRATVTGACALDCPDACSWVVEVDDGRALGLRGNPEHPYTRGGLCAKVNSYLDYTASPDRLLTPMRRVGAKGEGRFEPITWDDALGLIADAITTATREHGPEAVWPFGGTGTIGVLQGSGGAGQRLFHHLGFSLHAANICSVAGHSGLRTTIGTAMGLDPELLPHAGLVVLWGTNTLTTNLHTWPFVQAARDAGAPLVVVDPVRTRTAARADVHLAPRPGTDGALALGVAHHLHAIGAVDEAYLAEHALGWPQWRDAVLPRWTPSAAASVCGLQTREVEAFAELIAEHRPLAIRTLMGVQRHGAAAQALRLMSLLPALTGAYAQVGGGLCYSTGAAYGLDYAALGGTELLPPGPPPRTLLMSELGRVLTEVDDPPVRVLLCWAANPVLSNPDQHAVRAGLARDDLFTVVVDQRLSETAAYADVVLPGATQVEQADLVESYGHLYAHWNAPAVAPRGQALAHTEIFRRLAVALGVTEQAVLASDEELALAALGRSADGSPAQGSRAKPATTGLDVDLLASRGWARLALPEPYVPFADRFATASGKVEFCSEAAERAGLGLLPDWTPPLEAGRPSTGEGTPGGLSLVSPASHHLLNSTFTASPRHAKAVGEPMVQLHPDDAAARGITDGATVRIGNERGAFTARASVTNAVRPGVVVSVKGLRTGADGTSVNATTSQALADDGKGATFHDNRVEVTPLP